MKKQILILLLALGIFLVGCTDETSTQSIEEPNDLIPVGFASVSTAYYQHADTLIFEVPHCNCIDSFVDSSSLLKILPIKLYADTLIVQLKQASSLNGKELKVSYFSKYIRIGANNSNTLVGQWKKDSSYVQIEKLASSVTIDSNDISTANLALISISGYENEYLDIKSGIIKYYFVPVVGSYASELIRIWNDRYKKENGYKVNLDSLEVDKVLITGLLSNDSILVKKFGNGDIVWASSDEKSYPSHKYFKKPAPENCPNYLYPVWINKFASENKEVIK